MWGIIKALVRFVIFFSISEIFIFQVDKSESTKTGLRLFFIIELAVEIIVKDGIILGLTP